MGYILNIGEAAIETDSETGPRFYVEPATINSFSETTTFNEFRISYSEMHQLAKDTGLYQLFFGNGWNGREYTDCGPDFYRRKPLLRDASGATGLTLADARYINRQRMAYLAQINMAHEEGMKVDNRPIFFLGWLDTHVCYAVTNCNIPILAVR